MATTIMKPHKEASLMVIKTAPKREELFARYYQLDNPILRGIGNIADIFATTYELDFITRSDRDALMSDVQNIGDDMRIAMSQFNY